ncbi:MAG: DUF3078 domain-containing protein [Bacteroidales bacterium]
MKHSKLLSIISSILFIFTLFNSNITASNIKPILPPLSKNQNNDSIKKWTVNGLSSLTFNQLSLTNWAAGGESSLAGKLFINLNANYVNGKFSNQNAAILAYGLISSEQNKTQKTDDKIDLSSSFNYVAYKNWSYSALAQLKTQFANGFKYPDDTTVISTFFAPAYLTISLGMNYTPTKSLSLFFAPAAGRFTFVLNQTLADNGAFGVKKAKLDDNGNVLVRGKNLLGELGINFVLKYNEEIFKNIQINSILNLFNNYLDDNENNRWNIDVDWETNLNFVVNKYISAILYWHLIYDHDVKIPTYEIIDGKKTEIKRSPKLQFKESLGISLTYKF